MGITLKRHRKSPAKTQISNLENPFLFINQQILRLQIPISNTQANQPRHLSMPIEENKKEHKNSHL